MKLEKGKAYRSRDGDKWVCDGFSYLTNGRFVCRRVADDQAYGFLPDGKFSADSEHGFDMVGEWVEHDDEPAAPPADVKKAIADEALRVVTGARQDIYGGPEDNFARIARYWTAHFHNTERAIEVTPLDVAFMMTLLKLARLNNSPAHRDSHVDAVGYLLCGAQIANVSKV